jgi:hypothetical protein
MSTDLGVSDLKPNNSLAYEISRGKVPLRSLTLAHGLKKCPLLIGIQNFIAVFRTAHHSARSGTIPFILVLYDPF